MQGLLVMHDKTDLRGHAEVGDLIFFHMRMDSLQVDLFDGLARFSNGRF